MSLSSLLVVVDKVEQSAFVPVLPPLLLAPSVSVTFLDSIPLSLSVCLFLIPNDRGRSLSKSDVCCSWQDWLDRRHVKAGKTISWFY